MTNSNIATSSAVDLAAKIQAKELSAVELLDMYLDRIERLNGPINAVVTLDADRARANAIAADQETVRGNSRGPLHGLPITIKDAIEVAGVRSTGGAIELTNHVPNHDAPSVAKLKAAGAIVFGKTNVPRWSGEPQTFNDIFGTTNNPWATDCTPSGSSGGAAAAVAAGFTSFEVGTDIGGSVRMPAHCCGVFGLKPSYGVISQRGYLDRIGGGTTDVDINVFGPIARSIDDIDVLLTVLGGPPPEQQLGWNLQLPAARFSEAKGLRIGIWFEQAGMPIDTQVLALLHTAAEQLRAAGALVDVAHPAVDFDEQNSIFFQLIGAAISPSLPDELAHAMAGSHRDWLTAQQRRTELQAIWADWFTEYDILLCPVWPTPAFAHSQAGDFITRTVEILGEPHPQTVLVQWPGLIGLMNLPSVSAPIGRTRENLPVGMQIVAPLLRDRDAIAVARILSDINGGYTPPPGF